jgi:hypothetical protein
MIFIGEGDLYKLVGVAYTVFLFWKVGNYAVGIHH